MSNQTMNYIDTHFEFKELTTIQGRPTYETLKTLHNQLKANAKSVRSQLGGGTFRHLGLVLTPNQYAQISNIPFVHPALPGPLVLPNNPTAAQIRTLTEMHKETLRVFQEVNGVANALTQQLVSAIDDIYLQPLRNRVTNSIDREIGQILTYFKNKYGKVKQLTLQQETIRVQTMTYNPLDPIETVYNEIEDLAELAEAAQTPFSQDQIVSMGYDILNKNGKFKTSIGTWIARPIADKTWVHFKTHFSDAYEILEETGELTLDDSQFTHQANMIHEAVTEAIQDAFLQVPSFESEEIDQTKLQVTNLTMNQQQSTIDELRQEIKDLKALVLQVTNNTNNNNSTSQLTHKQKKERFLKRHGLYCWFHGGCTHTSKQCTKRRVGHQEDATFENKMGGETKFYTQWNDK